MAKTKAQESKDEVVRITIVAEYDLGRIAESDFSSNLERALDQLRELGTADIKTIETSNERTIPL